MVAALICSLLAGTAQTTSFVTPVTQYFGIYANGNKLGYAVYTVAEDTFRGQKALKGTITSEITVRAFRSHSETVTYLDPSGRPIESIQDTDSQGKRDHVVTEYGPELATVTGKSSSFKSKIPKGGKVSEDLILSALMCGDPKLLGATTYYMLDWDTERYSAVTLTDKGPVTLSVNGGNVRASWLKMHIEPGPKRDEMTDAMNKAGNLYFKEDGQLLKAEMIQFLVMSSESRAVAMGGVEKELALDDLFKIKAVGPIPKPTYFTRLKVKIAADSALSDLPSDDHQTATKDPDGWTLDIHPPHFSQTAGVTIKQAWALQPDWVKPDRKILCDTPANIALARKIIGNETDVLKAAQKIQKFVATYMQYDEKAIGDHNSNEIYESKRGVCVDFAILTAALMRGAGIPARLAAGLVSPDDEFGTFYGHEWVEVYDGSEWVGVEATSPDSPQVEASYIQLACGSSDQIAASPALQAHHPVLTIVSAN